MEFFDNMDNTQKIILGIAVVTLVIAIVLFFMNRNKGEGMQHTPVAPEHVEEEDMHSLTPIPEVPEVECTKILVMFFAPWCGHCKNMEPAWDEFTQNFDGYNGVKIVKVNGQDNPELAQIHNVSGFPSVKLCTQGIESPEGIMYEGDRSVGSLAQFLQQNA